MLFDLLRLGSIGQNMELLASLHQARQHHHHQNRESQQSSQSAAQVSAMPHLCRAHQDFHCNDHFRHIEADAAATAAAAASNQCKPLDLTVKNATEAHARQSVSNSRIRPARLAPLIVTADQEGLPNGGSAIKRKRLASNLRRKRNITGEEGGLIIQSSDPHNAARLISSSTSPSSCSRSASSISAVSASSNESKSCNNDLISSTNNNLSSSLNLTTTAPTTTPTTTTTTTPTSKRQKQKNLKSHLCRQCGRSFSRSDMLTRHSRLHSGLKPYQCGKCKQVFSRSDHLSTHERTHTGEKPYQCEQCAYSACRRDMITRHMRTHSASSTDPARAIRRLAVRKEDKINHSEPIDCIKSEFNFEQEDISSSLDDNSAITGDDDESDVGLQS